VVEGGSMKRILAEIGWLVLLFVFGATMFSDVLILAVVVLFGD